MKNKLTREQAEYLIEGLRNQSFDLYGIHPNSRESSKGFSYEAIENFINQCTEPEFPTIEMLVHGTKIIFTLADGVYTIHLELVDALESAWVRLDYPTFKVLAKDINKIVDWIDEQE